MSLKEILNQSRIEIAQEAIERDRLRKIIEVQEEERRNEARKKEYAILAELEKPYKLLIDSSGCLDILNELISLEGLTKEYSSKRYPSLTKKEAAEPKLSFDYGIDIQTNALSVKECLVSLEWDRCECTRGSGNYDYSYVEMKCINIIFTSDSIEILGNNSEGLFTKKNINKKSLEKSISRAYINPIIKES